MFFRYPAACNILTLSPQTEDVGQAHPRIAEAVATMVKKGKWTVPGKSNCIELQQPPLNIPSGYKEKFGDLNVM